MTYPEARYPGDRGERSATYRPASAPPELDYGGGNRAHYLATGASTGGDFGLYRWEMGASPGGPAAHFHRAISESFFILTGRVRIFDGEEWIDAAPGDFVHVPAGGVHAFRNDSGEPATMLLHFAPGAPREGYFEGLPRLRELKAEQRDEFFVHHDTFWV
jgi:mannose-6-phosphate isomerase-like protein (cupin superfamily)